MRGISAVIPVYNGATTIARAIDSVLAQRFDGEIELVVVNDGSTDSTPHVLERYGSKINVLTQPNRGLAAARNAGAAATSGDYLAFLDADDYWLPDHLARTSAALDRNPKAVLAFCDGILLDERGEEVDPSPAGRAPTMEDLLRCSWRILSDAVIMRRSVFALCGGFCEEFTALGGEDVHMWLRAREHGEFEYVPERLVVYNIPPFMVRAEKYDKGCQILIRLIRRRYGRAAKPLIDHVSSYFAPAFVQKALQQMDSGDWKAALHTWARLLRLKPSHLLDWRYVQRLFRPRNLRRLTGVFHAPIHAERS